MTDYSRQCRICGEGEAVAAIWQGGDEQSRTFVCTKCSAREEKLAGGGAPGASATRLAAFVTERQAKRAGADPDKGCPVCGSSLATIAEDGILGCGYCYSRFAEEVAVSVRSAHGNAQHIGKSPFA